MEIIKAEHLGFCFGVREAVRIAEKAAKDAEGTSRRIYTGGMLIHNRRVTADLKEKGIDSLDDITEAEKGSVIIVRSHGEPKSFYEEADRLGLEIIDATCPFVARTHELAENADKENAVIVIAGDKNHPEVIGTNGYCGGRAVCLNDGDEAQKWLAEHDEKLSEKKIVLMAQTTMRREVFEDILAAFRERGIEPEVYDTICSATSDRQKACEETAKIVDAMVIVGDVKSSNTKKLHEIASKYAGHAYFVEKSDDLPLKEIRKYNRIGIAAGASTPDYAIKEVISIMSENITETTTMEELLAQEGEEFERSLRLPRGGELATGTVIQVSDKEIIVNLGCKKDGIIPSDEISLEGDQKLTEAFSVGDEIQAKVLKNDDGNGNILLSKKKLEASEHFEEIARAYEDKTMLDVVVTRQVNGGVIGAYKEVTGFIPMSQLSDRYVEDASEFIGETLTVKVSRIDPRRGKAVFSHKAYLNEERQKALEKVWQSINVDDIVEGTVMRFTDYGAFVDIGGIDGLLHISEISWGKLKHPKEVLSIGQKINVKILSMNEEKGKISLGLKQTTPEPWSVINQNYHVGEIVSGKVVQIKEYGCFIELEPGLDGLVHISEIKNERVADINDEMTVGQVVNAKILEIDTDRKRISLSIKEAMNEMPAEETEEPSVEDADVEADAPVAEEVPVEVSDEAPAAEETEAPDAAPEEAEQAPEKAEEAEEAAAEEAEESQEAEESEEAQDAEETSEEAEESQDESSEETEEAASEDEQAEEPAEEAAE